MNLWPMCEHHYSLLRPCQNEAKFSLCLENPKGTPIGPSFAFCSEHELQWFATFTAKIANDPEWQGLTVAVVRLFP
jgi:hypothetical protein